MSINNDRRISEALENHCRFLAYVRVNALLHDCDKSFAQFLLWSLKHSEAPHYKEHNKSTEQGKPSVKRKEYLQYWQNSVICTTEDIHDSINVPFPSESCYAAYFDQDKNGPFHILQEKTAPSHSIYDFFVYHHDRPNFIEQAGCSSALFLFISGVAGLDGNDTGYESEMKAAVKNYSGHHTPDTAQDNIVLISTPFGFERIADLACAETACHFTEKIQNVVEALRQNNQPMLAVAELERKLEQPFRNTVIRTNRPINDITLADHSISTAALTVAQAARVVLENIAAPDDTAYCLPVRRPCNNAPSQETAFAVFSCAVNAGKLDQMALELKDITAIRDEVKKLLNRFITLFSEEYPVGGKVYQDQHGAHVVVPILGEPTKRWVKGGEDKLVRINLEEPGQRPEWADAPPDALTNDQFVDWLFATTKEELLKVEVNFGIELLIGLRYQPIEQELNKLAHAINWSRSLSSLSMMAGIKGEDGEKIRAFNYGRADTKEVTFDLCGVCGLRQGIPENKHRKCTICEERTKPQRTEKEETGNIEDLEQASGDNRMALLTVSFNLSQWLAETSNSGIFCHNAKLNEEHKEIKDKKKRQELLLQQIENEKIGNYQRFNSFGRFRRIWRSTEIFLEQLRDQIREISGRSEKENRFLMRTILLAPQDLQIILPAAKARQALDAVYTKFREEFGRVSDRMPFHVSLCIFPFRVPIYLVLEAARRLRQSCLKTEPELVELNTELQQTEKIILRTDSRTDCDGRERSFTYCLPMIWTQEHQPPNIFNTMKGDDQFHANLCIERDEKGKATKWLFVGNVQNGQQAWMTDNRLAIVEINSGFSLDELARPSEELPPSRCHDIPLGYWPCLEELISLESRLSEKQQRGMRSVLAMREKLWQESDLPGTPIEKQDFLRRSIRWLWQEPSRFGPKGWEKLDKYEKELLVESCLNGAIFFASTVKKYLQDEHNKEQDHGCKSADAQIVHA